MEGISGTGQLAFEGLTRRRPPRDRLFLATCPPPDIGALIDDVGQRLARDRGLCGRHIAPERLHITLYALDPRTGVSEALVKGLCRTVARLNASPFAVSFDVAGSVTDKPLNRPLVMSGGPEGLSDLAAFRRRLVDGLVAAGLGDPRAIDRFEPHVTLLYDDAIVRPMRISPIRWTVRDFALIRSHVGRTIYDELGRWTLGG